jgi:hypothetical protein
VNIAFAFAPVPLGVELPSARVDPPALHTGADRVGKAYPGLRPGSP